MASLNKVQLIGNAGRDPEMKTLPSGTRIANLSVATTDRWKDKQTGEQKEETQWHRVIFFDRLAEIVGEYVTKGAPIYVEGRLKYGKYTDKDGVEKYTTDITASSMQLLGRREEGGRDGGEQQERRNNESHGQRRAPAPAPARHDDRRQPAAKPSSGFDDMDDDIPFLFNVSSVCDTLGQSKSRHRVKHGPKALHILRVNQAEF